MSPRKTGVGHWSASIKPPPLESHVVHGVVRPWPEHTPNALQKDSPMESIPWNGAPDRASRIVGRGPIPTRLLSKSFSRVTCCDSNHIWIRLERKTGVEPVTFSLARRRSTTEPLPLAPMSTALPEGAEGQNRTGDTSVFSAVLYRLSYLGGDFHVIAAGCECQGEHGVCARPRSVAPGPGRYRPRLCSSPLPLGRFPMRLVSLVPRGALGWVAVSASIHALPAMQPYRSRIWHSRSLRAIHGTNQQEELICRTSRS